MDNPAHSEGPPGRIFRLLRPASCSLPPFGTHQIILISETRQVGTGRYRVVVAQPEDDPPGPATDWPEKEDEEVERRTVGPPFRQNLSEISPICPPNGSHTGKSPY